MTRNGPSTRLSSAPGRRTTSISSLPMNEVVRTQVLTISRKSSTIAEALGLLAGGPVACDELGEHLVERRPVLPAAHDLATHTGERLQNARRRLASTPRH